MSYNKGGLFILLGSVFFSFVWFAYLVIFPPAMELAELEGESQAVLPKAETKEGEDLSQIENPWISSESLVSHGSQVYQTYCASCHGKTGQGDGLAAKGLKPPPRNLIKGGWKQGGGSIDFYKTLVQGVPGSSMVSFSYLSKVDRWALVHYVRSITEDKKEDDIKQLEEFAKTAK